MLATKNKIKLENILELSHYMKIVIDEGVELDDNGNYLVNVGYLRVSTDRQAEQGYGLELQEKAIIDYCRLKGMKNLVLFIDDGFTGTNLDRPALQGLISAIQSYNRGRSHIRINTVIIHRIDRLSRSLLGTLQFIQDYIVAKDKNNHSTINTNKEDITFISINENYCNIEQTNPFAKMVLMLFATLAEFDRDTIVQKLKAGRTARVASGKWLGGGNTPYGYRYDRDLSQLIVVPEEAEKVREIFRLYIEEKMPPQKISDRLGFKGDKQIRDILTRKSLTGCIIYLGEEYKGQHEAIISLERWQEAQDELEKRSVHRAESNYLLSGLLVCGQCGAKMRYQKWNKNGECKLICYSKQKSKPNLVKTDDCDSEYFWAADVENAVVSELFRMTYLGNEDVKKSAATIDPSEALAKELKTAKQKLSRLYDFEDGEDDVLADKIYALKERIKQLQIQLNDEEAKKRISRKIEKAKSIFRSLESTGPHMTATERQSVCQELIDRVVIHKDGVIDVHLKLRSYLINK